MVCGTGFPKEKQPLMAAKLEAALRAAVDNERMSTDFRDLPEEQQRFWDDI